MKHIKNEYYDDGNDNDVVNDECDGACDNNDVNHGGDDHVLTRDRTMADYSDYDMKREVEFYDLLKIMILELLLICCNDKK